MKTVCQLANDDAHDLHSLGTWLARWALVEVFVIAIIVIACHVLQITFTSYDIVGMLVVVPCLTTALYRGFTVFGIGK